MKNIGSKSTNMCEIMVTMFSAPIGKILCFKGPHKMTNLRDFGVYGWCGVLVEQTIYPGETIFMCKWDRVGNI